MIIITRYSEATGWTTSGVLAEIERKTKAGELPVSIFLLCWQITLYGENYLKSLQETENVRTAKQLLQLS